MRATENDVREKKLCILFSILDSFDCSDHF